MSNIDLRGMPFNLDDKAIKWVEDTKASMTLEEKIGQLFFMIGFSTKQKDLSDVVKNIAPGGMMYRTTKEQKVSAAYKLLQSESKIPMLLAANLEAGGEGLVDEGTFYGHQMLVGASNNVENAYRLGLLCGREASAIGGNMAFAPIIDINFNFRNPITNIRSFGDKPELVAKMGAAYVKGAHDANLSVTIKHFPGDGIDGRDQHLVLTHNSLPFDKWMDTYGLAYKESIKVGARGLMAGHITLPNYIKEKHPDNKDLIYTPATLNPLLLNNLLREELGYNGLIMTDATLMTGFGQMGKRSDLVPMSIAAGCDMFLFTRQPEDDYNHMMNGYKNGVITDQRLDEALSRILAIKASLNLHNKSIDELVPNKFSEVNIEEHKSWAKELADQGVTLVKDNQNILPLDSKKHKKIGVLYNGNAGGIAAMLKDAPGLKGMMMKTAMKFGEIVGEKKLKPHEKLINSLNKHGFEAFYYNFGDIMSVMNDMQKPLHEWTSQFDAIIYLAKWEAMSNQTSLQLQYKAMGFDAPWFIEEIPTILVSVANPYHMYDLPMVKTVINAYSPTDEVYDAIAEKLVGKSKFKGVSPVSLDFDEVKGIL